MLPRKPPAASNKGAEGGYTESDDDRHACGEYRLVDLAAKKPRAGVKPPASDLRNLAGKPREQMEFVEKDQGRVVYHGRGPSGSLEPHILREGSITLDPPGIALALADLYFGTTLSDAQQPPEGRTG